MNMDCHLTTQFFSAFVEAVQKLCQDSVTFQHSVEVSGYVCLEIDSSKKERYVISELVQSTGNIVSESFCSKVFRSVRKPHATKCVQTEDSNSTLKQEGQAVTLTSRSFIQNSLRHTGINSRWPVPESFFTSTVSTSKSSDISSSPQCSLKHSKYANSIGLLGHGKGRHNHNMKRKSVPVRKLPRLECISNQNFESMNSNYMYMETLNTTDTSNPNSYSKQGMNWSQVLTLAKAHDTLQSSLPVTPSQTQKDDNPISTETSLESSLQLSSFIGPKIVSSKPIDFRSHEGALDLSIVKVECQELMQCEDGGVEKLNQEEKRTCEQLADKAEKKGRTSPSDSEKLKSNSENSCMADEQSSVTLQKTPIVLLQPELSVDAQKRPDLHGRNMSTSFRPSREQHHPLEQTLQSSGFGQMSEDTALQNNDEDYLDVAYESGKSYDETFDKTDMQVSFFEANLANANDGDQFLDSENKNTIRKTVAHVKLFQNYLKSNGEDRQFHTIPAYILDQKLGSFLVSIKKDDGEDYEPTYLRNIQSSLERYLRSVGYAHSITKHPTFQNSRYLLKCKQDLLVQQGKGIPNRTAPITAHDVNVLYVKSQLGCNSADALLNTLWFSNTVHFGIKSTKDHHSLKWGDIIYGQTEEGLEFIEYIGYSSKYRETSMPLRIYAQSDYPARCPVMHYKVYAKNRPEDFCRTENPYYLAVNNNRTPEDVWYKRQQTGLNRMGSMLKRMSLGAGFPQEKRLTNLSAQKHGVTQGTDNISIASARVV